MDNEELEKLFKQEASDKYGQKFDVAEDPEDEDLSDCEWWEK